MARRLVLATRNDHKVRELGRLLGGQVDIEPLPEAVRLPPETGTTYAENALIKARAAQRATRADALADDSGIEAAALEGAPGVRSARFAGPDATDAENLDLFRRRVPPGTELRYVCVIAHVARDGSEELFVGTCTGRMAAEPRGTRGFGYDPVFIPDDDGSGRTMAELDDAEKDAISHRGRAARGLLEWLRGS